jgi:hypothetical protein
LKEIGWRRRKREEKGIEREDDKKRRTRVGEGKRSKKGSL